MAFEQHRSLVLLYASFDPQLRTNSKQHFVGCPRKTTGSLWCLLLLQFQLSLRNIYQGCLKSVAQEASVGGK